MAVEVDGQQLSRGPAAGSAHRLTLVAAIFLAAFLLFAVGGLVPQLAQPKPAIVVSFATVGVLLLIAYLVNRSRIGQAESLLAPYFAPMALVSGALLLPLAVFTFQGDAVGGFGYGFPIADDTAKILALAIVGYSVGSSLPMARRVSLGRTVDGRALVRWGYIGLLVSGSYVAWQVSTGVSSRRGVDQLNYGLQSTVIVAVGILLSVSTIAVLAGRAIEGHRRLMALSDAALIGGVLLLKVATGSRQDAVAVLIVIAWYYAVRGGRTIGVVVAAAAVVGLMLAGLMVRASGPIQQTPAQQLLGDAAVPAFTTGVTVYHVPSLQPYLFGDTVFAALWGQMPGPLRRVLLDEQPQAGAGAFRDLIGFTNARQGLGFSLPAEGYLNFGVIGAVAIMTLLGSFTAWTFARFSLRPTAASMLLYPVVLANLPIMLRSDLLGATKSVLYSWVALVILLGLCRRRQSNASH